MEARGTSDFRAVQSKGKHCNRGHESFPPFCLLIHHASSVLNLVLISQGHLPVGILMRCFLMDIQNWILIILQDSYKLPF